MDTIVDSLFCFLVTLGEWEWVWSVGPSGPPGLRQVGVAVGSHR